MREIWARELGITQLIDNDRICELHFRYEDLNISDDTTTINGEIIVSVRKKITLKPNVRPVRDVHAAVSNDDCSRVHFF